MNLASLLLPRFLRQKQIETGFPDRKPLTANRTAHLKSKIPMSSVFGSAGENAAWNVVYGAYRDDHLEAAMEAALALSTGPGASMVRTYRQLEAEADTRKKSTIHRPTAWLQIEGREAADEQMQAAVAQILDATAQRYGFKERPNVMVTFLLSELDAPWAPGRAGYFVDKTPYYKICVPEALLEHPAELGRTLVHEYAHLIARHLAEGNEPRWLTEAFATLTEGYPIERSVQAFQSGVFTWRHEIDLNAAFVAEDNSGYNARVRQEAYSQGAIIGRYLQNLKGDLGFASLFRGFADNSLWTNITMNLTGQEPVDEALREVYGFGVKELFERAKPT